MRNFTPIFSKLRNDLQSLSLRRIGLWETLWHRKTAPLPKGSWICQRQRLRDNFNTFSKKYHVGDIKKDSNYFVNYYP